MAITPNRFRRIASLGRLFLKVRQAILDSYCYIYSYMLAFSTNDSIQKVLAVVTRLGGTAHTASILAAGVHPRYLYRARDTGQLIEVTRGVFRLASRPLTNPDLIAAVTRMPKAIFCLITALHFHGLTQEIPRAVHIALPRGTHPARMSYPPLEIYHLSATSYAAGVEEHFIDEIRIRITTPAKSVVDAFKFRSRIGSEAALDALKQTLRSHKATPAEIDHMARINRVHGTIRPYLEALA